MSLGPKRIDQLPVIPVTGNEYVPLQIGDTTGCAQILDILQFYGNYIDGEVNVKLAPWFARGDGIADDYLAIQSAINFCKNNKKRLLIPSGTYVCSQPLNIGRGSVIEGESIFASDPRSIVYLTKLVFPSSSGFLVSQSDAESGYVWGVSVKNLSIVGGSAFGSKGFHARSLATSLIENVGISNFARGLDVDFGMFSTFTNINSSLCTESSLYISGVNGITTTQTFNQCVFRQSPYALIVESTPTGSSYGTVFNQCTFESTTVGGANVHRSCGVTFNDHYCENVPGAAGVANSAVFRLFFDGYEQPTNNYAEATFNGGDISGANGGVHTGSGSVIIDVGRCNQVTIFGGKFQRGDNGIRCDSTLTPNGSVFLFAPEFVQVNNLYVNTNNKISGVYSDFRISGTRRTRVSNGPSFWLSGSGNPNGVESAPLGSLYSTGTGTAGATFYVKETDAAGSTGWTPQGAFTQPEGGILQTTQNKLAKQKLFSDYFTNPAADNWGKLQSVIDSLPSGAVLDVTSTVISDALLITKPITLRATGAGSVIRQTSWGKPHFLVDQASDLTLQGNFSLRYEGARTLITALPTSTDARIQAIYTAVGTAPGNPRTLAAGVYLRQKCDRFHADYLSVYGQVSGIVQANANVYANYSDECSVGQLDVDTIEWGYLSGGFKRLSFGVINAKNITSTQGDPTHAIYVGPRTVRNGTLSIGELNVDGCTIISDASDQLRAADAFSIRGTEMVSIGAINIRNAQYLGNFQDGRFIVGSISGVLLPLLSGTLSADLAVPFAVQNNADVSIGQWCVESALGWDVSQQPSFFVSTSSGGKLRINSGTQKMTGAKPGNFARNSSGTLDVRGLDIEYTNEFDVAYPNPAAYLVTTTLGTGATLITDPSLRGTERLLLAPAANADWRIWLNQQKIALNTPNTVIDASGAYHVNFMSWPDVPPVVPAFTGTAAVQMRSRAVLAINNTAGASIAACHSGCTPNQEYMLTCTDNFTTIQNNANIVTKTAANVPVGWKWFLYRVVGTVAYEISRA